MSADDIPARHDRLAAAMLTPLVDHGLREAVKWVMEPELIAMEAEIEQQVRAKVAEEIRTIRPDTFGAWNADQAYAAQTTKEQILKRVTRGDQ